MIINVDILCKVKIYNIYLDIFILFIILSDYSFKQNKMDPNLQIIIENKFKIFLNHHLGSGAFGNVYLGIDLLHKDKIAIKIEPKKLKSNQLYNEFMMLNYLRGLEGIPLCRSFISSNDSNCLIMSHLGINLEHVLSLYNRHLNLITTAKIGLQILARLESIHKLHVIHRDVKPENFLTTETHGNSLIYIIDFGLAKRFRDPKNGNHIPYKDNKPFVGTARYASVYTHFGIEQSRRDDLESMVYTLIYLNNGSLPWQCIKAKSKEEKYQKILEMKMTFVDNSIDMPSEFIDMLTYVRNLQFNEVPNYNVIRDKLNNIIQKNQSCDCNWKKGEEKCLSFSSGMETSLQSKKNSKKDNNEDEKSFGLLNQSDIKNEYELLFEEQSDIVFY